MAICLPGMASSVKRAATSAMRPAPLVITMNCTIMRIEKMITPTKSESPATNEPKALMTLPATPMASSGLCASAVRIRRVEAMLSTRRSSVVASSSEGNTLNSSGRFMYSVVSSTITPSEMLTEIMMSSIAGGSGTSSTPSSSTKPTGTMNARSSVIRNSHSGSEFGLDCVSANGGASSTSKNRRHPCRSQQITHPRALPLGSCD